MGATTKRTLIIIGLDIDNKADDQDKNIYNGIQKMLELIKQHNINEIDKFKVGHNRPKKDGIHVIIEVTKDLYESIENITR